MAGTDVLTAMFKGILGVAGYSSGGFYQNTIQGIAGQYSLPSAWRRISISRLGSSGNVVYTEGCFPSVFPKAKCTLATDVPSVFTQGDDIWYTDGCYATSDSPTNVTGKEIHSNACGLNDGSFKLYYTLLGDLAKIMGSSVSTHVECSLSAEEGGMHLLWKSPRCQ